MASTKIPLRKIFQITSDVEKQLLKNNVDENNNGNSNNNNNNNNNVKKNESTAATTNKFKRFSANFNGNRKTNSLERNLPTTKTTMTNKYDKKNVKTLLQEKDVQIDKLVERITSLHSINNQYSNDIEQYQTDIKRLNDELIVWRKAKVCNLLCEQLQTNEIKLKTDMEILLEENRNLNDDIKMLKMLIYRLNIQLERHQEIIHKCKKNDKNDGDHHLLLNYNFNTTIPNSHGHENDDNSNGDEKDKNNAQQHINWLTNINTHTLGPLLNAYEETIFEKSQLIQNYENDFLHFTGRLKLILEENEKIHEQMTELRKQNELWSIEKTRLQAQYEICRSKAEIQSKRADLAKEKLIEVLRCYEHKLQTQNLDVERLQEAYGRTKGELTSLRYFQQHQKPEIVAESLKECQKLFEELKKQYEIEKQKLISELDVLKQKSDDGDSKFVQLNEECNQLKVLTKRQKECNEILVEKNSVLRQNLSRVRESREILKNRLKNTGTLYKNRNFNNQQQTNQEQLKDFKIEEFLQQKDHHMQLMNIRYLDEINKLTRKLKQREETLRKILQNKIQTKK